MSSEDSELPSKAEPQRPRSRWARRVGWVTLSGFVVLNALAFAQAWSMTHYAVAGEKSKPIEKLSFWDKCKVLCVGPTVMRPQNKLKPVDYGMDVQVVSLPSTDGMTLEAWRANFPGRPVVLMFPGYANSKDTLLKAAQEFQKNGFEPWMIDFRGCGGSSGSVTTIGWYEADDVAAVVAAVRAENPTRKVLLYGQSLGSAAILRAVGTGRARPDAIIAEAPFDSLLQTVGNRFSAIGLPRFPFAHLLTFWGGAQHGFNAFKHSPAEAARGISVPTLVMMGENDNRVGLDASLRIVGTLGSNGTFHLFKGRRHAFLLQDATEEWRDIVAKFLREKSGM